MGRISSLPILVCLTFAVSVGPVTAQIATDGIVGPRVNVPGRPEFAIGAELGTRAGNNLFHSFERFSLRTGESATFSGPDAIRNVISRVTGGERSEIDGTIASTIEGADFYFINPAGVLFGPNASVDVSGSFHVATANELRFADGAAFSASEPAASSLTVASPEAFGFLGRDAERIELHRTALPVAPDRSLSLVGGDIVIDQSLIAVRDDTRNGNVTLVAMSRPGTVAVTDGSTSAAPQGDISIRGRPFDHGINLSSAAGGGVVRIRAGALEVQGADIVADSGAGQGPATALVDIEANSVRLNAFVGTFAAGAGDAGDVRVTAEELTILNGFLRSDTEGDGDAGNVTVSTHELEIAGGDIASVGFAAGNAGNVTVSARELEITSGGVIGSDSFGGGNAGNVIVNAEQLSIDRGDSDDLTGISSSVFLPEGSNPADVTGDAGIIRIEAGEVTVVRDGIISSNSFAAGEAGRITLTADRIVLSGGGQIGSGTLGQSTGDGGNVEVTAREELTIWGRSAVGPEPSGIFVSTESESPDAGNAGTATVTAPVITIADRGEIASESLNPADGGALLVSAERVVIDDGEITTKAESSGDGGRISVRAGVLEFHNGGLISSEASGDGDAGSIEIRADRLLLDDGTISTNSATAGGGAVELRVGDVVDLHDSEVTTSVGGGDDPTAGNITIDPKVLIIDGSRIQANARDAPMGEGGEITIVADNVLVPGGNFQAFLDRQDISATGGPAGVAGTIVVNAPEVDLSGGLVVLEGALLDAASQLRERCGARRDIGASSFTGVGRGGLPPSPDAPLFGAYVVDQVATGEAQKAGSRPGPGTVPASVRLAGLIAPCAPLD